jgi:hypothetical protein
MAGGKASEDRKLTALGARIMRAAEDAGFTQTSLERAARFSGGYLTRILYREQDRIDLTKLEVLCDLLSVRMHWLATGREPMREGGPRSAVEEAMIVARSLNVTEDVFWFVRGRDGNADRTASEWLEAFLADNRKRVEDASYARAAKRVAMTEAKRSPPPSQSHKRRAS